MGNEIDKRCEPRHRTFKRGMIVFNERSASSECTIKNESTRGAMLSVTQNHIIPNHFEIRRYPEHNYRPAKVRWRTETAIGILYQDLGEELVKPILSKVFNKDIADEDIMKEMETGPAHHHRDVERRKGERRSGDRRRANREENGDAG